MQRMCRKHVFSSCRGIRVINMPRLSASLQRSSRELNLHLHCGLLGASWRPVLELQFWEVQERGIRRLPRLPGSLQLSYCEHCDHCLLLQRWLDGA